MKDNSCHFTDFVGDNPKRSFAREALSHASYYACEYCTAHAAQYKDHDENVLKNDVFKQQCSEIQRKIKIIKESPGTSTSNNDDKIRMLTSILNDLQTQQKKYIKHSHLVWPSSTCHGENRTIENIMNIIDENDGEIRRISSDTLQGFTGKSLLLEFPQFDFIHGVPCEYMHTICLGVIKKMLVLTFNLGEKRHRSTTRKLTPPSQFSRRMKNIKVPREFSRRGRNLDISVLKAQELRNIGIIFFPIIVDCIEKEAKEIRLWLLLAFIVRACIIPESEYEIVVKQDILNSSHQFYALYEQLFSVKNCTYNTHVFGSHILDMRTKGPLTMTSAFPFESFYSELRHSFTPGTVSPVKQMLQKVCLRRALSHHCCETSIYLCPKDTQLECNSLIYTFINEKHVIYQIESIDDDNSDILHCLILGRFPVDFPATSGLDWSSVGLYRIGPLSDDIVTVSRCRVDGKVVRVHDFLLTCSTNILREK